MPDFAATGYSKLQFLLSEILHLDTSIPIVQNIKKSKEKNCANSLNQIPLKT